MLSRFVIAFLPRNKCLNFMAAVTICSDFGAQGNQVCHYFHKRYRPVQRYVDLTKKYRPVQRNVDLIADVEVYTKK